VLLICDITTTEILFFCLHLYNIYAEVLEIFLNVYIYIYFDQGEDRS